jgi:hypothetical protein
MGLVIFGGAFDECSGFACEFHTDNDRPAAPVVKICLLSMLNVAQNLLEMFRGSHVPDPGVS